MLPSREPDPLVPRVPATTYPLRAERGAVLVEAAIVVVVLGVFIAGVAQASLVASTATLAERTASSAARVAASAEPGSSDAALLAQVATMVGGANATRVVRVVVYRPDGATGRLPGACVDLYPESGGATGAPGSCNVYGPEHLVALVAGGAGPAGCGSGSWERWWCPAARRGPGSHTSLVGVRVELAADAFPGGWRGPTAQVTAANAVARLEEHPG